MRTGSVQQMQKRSWGYYGWAGSPNLPVGEVRYVVGWHADQMTRLEWDVLIDGSDVWSVDLNSENTPPENRLPVISTTREDGEQDVTAASKELLDLIDWTDSAIRAVDTNLFVAGQGDYIQTPDGWRVLSVVETNRNEKLKAAKASVPFIWPHPADPDKPDAPLFAVLELLSQLEWLDRQAQTQSRQRALISGVLATADSLEGPDGKTFFDMWNEVFSARMSDPDDLSPIQLQGPLDVIKDGLNWIMPPFGYDGQIDRRSVAAIQRLAYGLPIPPEILLGLQAQSRATAFQVEENAYRAHIEPPAWMVAQVPQDALESILDGVEVEVRPNPTQMLARKQSVEDVKWAFEMGIADTDYTREVLAIPDDAAPENDGVPIRGTAPIAQDPANDAAGEASPITAASSEPNLSDLLADIDAHLSSELAGVTVMATGRARERLGAKARARNQSKLDPEWRNISNVELAAHLGVDGLKAAGVDVISEIADPIDMAAKWWTKRVGQAWAQVSTLVPEWSGQGAWVEESIDALDVALASHIVNTLSEPDPSPLDAGAIRTVIDAAAGDRSGIR